MASLRVVTDADGRICLEDRSGIAHGGFGSERRAEHGSVDPAPDCEVCSIGHAASRYDPVVGEHRTQVLGEIDVGIDDQHHAAAPSLIGHVTFLHPGDAR